MRFILLVMFVSLSTLGPLVTVQAQESCTRVYITFRTAQETELSGKLGVRYEDNRTVGFVDFHIEATTIAGGDEARIGAFNIIDMASFKITFNDDEVNSDGDGAFRMRKADCADTLPTDDGRLNPDDPASLAVIYANDQTKGYDVYLIDAATGSGRLSIRASRAMIDAARLSASEPGGINTLIADEETVALWALTSGECQRNAFYADGKPDVFIFECGR